ncbi:MAG: T9SS type A sorting domain-containing protein [Cytophagales bacterium]
MISITNFMRFKSINTLIVLAFCQSFSQSNLSVGQWANHFPLMKTNSSAKGNGFIWVGCDFGMFKYDYEENSTESFRTYESFANFEIAALSFNNQTKSFVIGYKTGDLDIVEQNGNTTTMSQIRRSLLLGDKLANHLFNHKNLCFVSTDIGLVVVDVNAKKVLETFSNVSPNAQSTVARNSTLLNDTLYLTEKNGRLIYVPYRSNINKMDFQNWRVLNATNGVNEGINSVFAIGENLFVFTNSSKLLKKNGTTFSDLGYAPHNSSFRKFKVVSDENFALIYDSQVHILNKNGDFNFSIERNDVTDVETDGSVYYLTTREKGIVKFQNNQFSSPVFPNSPFNLTFSRSFFDDGRTYFMPTTINIPSGAANVPIPLTMSIFDGKEWMNVSRESHPSFVFNNAFDGTVVGDSLYFSNFDGMGVVHKKSFEGKNLSKSLPPLNTNGQPGSTPFYMSLMKKDQNNNLYITGFLAGLETAPMFHKRNARTKEWQSFNINIPAGRIMLDMVMDNSGNKWIFSAHFPSIAGTRINGEGLIVFNEISNQFKRLTTLQGNGNLTSTKIYCVEKAQNGEIWVGTDNGISVFFNPERVLSSSTGWDASVPVYDSRALMREKTVTAIKADAADRKWIGTQTEGAWLFTNDGSQLIYNFNTSNSPLPSDNIIAIDINPRNGEVMFSTEKGMAFFREGVASTAENLGTAEIFPNPVSENYSGKITFGSLAQDAVVKITDVSGKLVHQTQALGATAFWDGNDLNGRRAKTGVYLVFTSTKMGEDKLVGKFIIKN